MPRALHTYTSRSSDLDLLLDMRAFRLGAEYARATEGVYDSPLSGEWADRWTPETLRERLNLLPASSPWHDPELLTAACDAFESGYAAYAEHPQEFAQALNL